MLGIMMSNQSMRNQLSLVIVMFFLLVLMSTMLFQGFLASTLGKRTELSQEVAYQPRVFDTWSFKGNTSEMQSVYVDLVAVNETTNVVQARLISTVDSVLNTIDNETASTIIEVNVTHFRGNETIYRINEAPGTYHHDETSEYNITTGWSNTTVEETGNPQQVVLNYSMTMPYNQSYVPRGIPLDDPRHPVMIGGKNLYLPVMEGLIESFKLNWRQDFFTTSIVVNDLNFSSISVERWTGTNTTTLILINEEVIPELNVIGNISIEITLNIAAWYDQNTRMILFMSLSFNSHLDMVVDDHARDDAGNLTDIHVTGSSMADFGFTSTQVLFKHGSLYLTLPSETSEVSSSTTTTTQPEEETSVPSVSTPGMEFLMMISSALVILAIANRLRKNEKP